MTDTIWMRMSTATDGTERWVAKGFRAVEIPASLLKTLRLRDSVEELRNR